MFARWKMAGKASIVAAVAASTLLVSAPSVRALEGIHGRHAIFYPSLELVYQHDDNFFLVPNDADEVAADSFLAKAHFALEVPGARQYLRMEYAPQWRNVNVDEGRSYDVDEDISHFWDLQARLKGTEIFGVDIDQKFTVGNLEVYELDPDRGDDLIRSAGERFTRHDLGVTFKWEGSRQGADVMIGHNDTNFDDTEDAPPWYELSELRGGVRYFYKFTPLTRFFLGISMRDAELDYTNKLVAQTGIPGLDASMTNVDFGFSGELGRTTTGTAKLGFVALDFDGTNNPAADFDGVTAEATVTKSFSRYAKLLFGADRGPNYSGYGANTYYVANRVTFTFTHQPQGGPVFWTVAGGFSRNTYDTPTFDANPNELRIHEREDDQTHLRGEIGYHPIEHLSLRLNYRHEERESNFQGLEWTDNLVIFQVQFGF